MPFLFSGEILAKYTLVRPVKCSKDAEVWIAYCQDGRYCILKVARGASAAAKRLIAAARLVGNLNCAHIARVFDCGMSESGFAYAALEYAGGGSIESRLSKFGRLTLGQTVEMLYGVLEALCLLHKAGVVHRDLKPANIWISDNGSAIVGDFGIAKLPNFPDEDNSVFGSAPYMSPEQAKNSAKVDGRSDIFSLGLVAYESLTGHSRYSGKNYVEILKQILSDRRSIFPELEPIASAPLASLLDSMASASLEGRPASAGEVISKMDSIGLPREPIL